MRNLRKILIILLGNAILALGIVAFIMPSRLITGGSAGIGFFMEDIFHIPFTITVSVFNIVMFTIGLLFLGKKFAATTLISTFWYPIILEIYSKIPQLRTITDDKVLSVVFAGLLMGLGIGMVIKSGASTGGLDIPPIVLNKKLGVPISTSLYVFDTVILLLQVAISDVEKILYGILLVLVYTTVLNKVLLMGGSKTQVKIISDKYEEINQAINLRIDRGTTFLKSETGYHRKETKVIFSVISNRELHTLKNIIMSIDPDAFIVINHVNEVRGRGFSFEKERKLK